jgi:hypothetical protein
MKVFMSWSGDRSREVAKLLDYWIKCVVQASRPWISTSGIDSGSIWFNQISSELQDTTFGIICITKENKEAPWILFEAGALAKGLASSRVCTFLIDLQTKDIRDPLAQFNHTLPNYESMWKLVSTLNGSMPEANRLDVTILKGVFETYWPQFEQRFNAILETYPETTVVEPRKQEDILAEILESTRGLERRLRLLEDRGNIAAHARPAARVMQSNLRFAGGGRIVQDLSDAQFVEVVAVATELLKAGNSWESAHTALIQEYGIGKKAAKEAIEVAASNSILRPPGDSPV